jgi:hypothetical protein
VLCGCGRIYFDPLSTGEVVSDGRDWIRTFGGPGIDGAHGLAFASDGSLLVTGRFVGTVDFGGGPLASAGSSDIFLARYGADGAFVWAKRFGGIATDESYAVVVDAADRVYLTGGFRPTVDFGGVPRSSAGGATPFVASFDLAGSFRWDWVPYSLGSAWGRGLAVDSNGGLAVIGEFTGELDLGEGVVTSNGFDSFVVRFDPGGIAIWSRVFAADNEALADYAGGIGVSGDGTVFLLGTTHGPIDFGGGQRTGNGSSDVYAASLDATGSHRWSKLAGDTNFDRGYTLAALGSGDVLVGGMFRSTIDFGGKAVSSTGSSADGFATLLDSTGTPRWAISIGGDGIDECLAVTFDGAANAYIVGHIDGNVDFGAGMIAGGPADAFVASFDALGQHRWSRIVGGPGEDRANAVAVDGSGNVAIAGTFTDTADFGLGSTHTSVGQADGFVRYFATPQ